MKNNKHRLKNLENAVSSYSKRAVSFSNAIFPNKPRDAICNPCYTVMHEAGQKESSSTLTWSLLVLHFAWTSTSIIRTQHSVAQPFKITQTPVRLEILLYCHSLGGYILTLAAASSPTFRRQRRDEQIDEPFDATNLMNRSFIVKKLPWQIAQQLCICLLSPLQTVAVDPAHLLARHPVY